MHYEYVPHAVPTGFEGKLVPTPVKNTGKRKPRAKKDSSVASLKRRVEVSNKSGVTAADLKSGLIPGMALYFV